MQIYISGGTTNEKKLVSIILTLSMLLTLVPSFGINAAATDPVYYLDEDGETQSCTSYTVVTGSAS